MEIEVTSKCKESFKKTMKVYNNWKL